MSRSATPTKPLKVQNRWQIWLFVILNSAFLYGVVQANTIQIDGVRSIFTDTSKLVPFGLAIGIATVLNGVLSANAKARLVFLRWRNALPGHRAFSQYAGSDPRIDIHALERVLRAPLPKEPAEQNWVWYRLYKTIENDPLILEAHKEFLLTRDFTGLAALFVIFFGSAGFYSIPSIGIAVIYFLLLIVQFFVVRLAAVHYGIRFVTNVLAQKAVAV
jgi:hypothetical protein